jgi:phosphoserine phosphatase RsbU/P
MDERCTVLIIDDEALIRLTIGAYLEDCGFRVLEAVDGRQGVELFLSARPDVVLTDLRMPELDGLGVIAAIKAQSPGTPVIAITGTGDPRAARETAELGACGCLFKPFTDLGILERAIVSALAASGSAAKESR